MFRRSTDKFVEFNPTQKAQYNFNTLTDRDKILQLNMSFFHPDGMDTTTLTASYTNSANLTPVGHTISPYTDSKATFNYPLEDGSNTLYVAMLEGGSPVSVDTILLDFVDGVPNAVKCGVGSMTQNVTIENEIFSNNK